VYLGRLELRFTPPDVRGDVFSADALQLRRGWAFWIASSTCCCKQCVRISERLLTWPVGQSKQASWLH